MQAGCNEAVAISMQDARRDARTQELEKLENLNATATIEPVFSHGISMRTKHLKHLSFLVFRFQLISTK